MQQGRGEGTGHNSTHPKVKSTLFVSMNISASLFGRSSAEKGGGGGLAREAHNAEELQHSPKEESLQLQWDFCVWSEKAQNTLG